MPRYRVRDDYTGKDYEVEADTPPTDQELQDLFGGQQQPIESTTEQKLSSGLETAMQPLSETLGLSPKEPIDPDAPYLRNVMAGLRNTGKSVINAAALPVQFPMQVAYQTIGKPLQNALEGTQPIGEGLVQAGKEQFKGLVDMIKSGIPGIDPQWAENLFENPDTVVFGKMLARDVARGAIRKVSDIKNRMQQPAPVEQPAPATPWYEGVETPVKREPLTPPEPIWEEPAPQPQKPTPWWEGAKTKPELAEPLQK